MPPQNTNFGPTPFVSLCLVALFGFGNIAVFYAFHPYLLSSWLLAQEPLAALVLRPFISPFSLRTPKAWPGSMSPSTARIFPWITFMTRSRSRPPTPDRYQLAGRTPRGEVVGVSALFRIAPNPKKTGHPGLHAFRRFSKSAEALFAGVLNHPAAQAGDATSLCPDSPCRIGRCRPVFRNSRRARLRPVPGSTSR